MSPATAVNKKKREFDPNTFLATIGDGRKNVAVGKKQTIFAQGDGADAVFYIQIRQGEAHRRIPDRPRSDHRHVK